MKHYRNIILSPVFLVIFLTPVLVTANDNKLYVQKNLSLTMANKAAQASIEKCRTLGYSVAVAIVDRGGNVQVILRDRFAGPHTIETASQKAWTANSFRQSTGTLAQLLHDNKIPDQVQHNPGALLVGGGIVIQGQGQTLGGIGVSGAPPGKSEQDSIDSQCAKAGIVSIREELEFSE